MASDNIRVTVSAAHEVSSDSDEIDSPTQQTTTTIITYDGASHTIEPISPQELRAKTVWIRDDLEPHVARNGSSHLTPDIVLELNKFLMLLRDNVPRLTLDILRSTRVHRAVLLIAGRGTRWPGGLVDICDNIIVELTKIFGKLELIRPLLYEKGGRLAAFSDEQKLGRHGMYIKWMGDPSSGVSTLNAHESGHLGFKPGNWWVHPVFAFHAGIIDSPDPHGGITADDDGAYAILVAYNDEVEYESVESFTYRCHLKDKGKYRLMAAMQRPKLSIRVLRSHTMHSPHSPAAGIRYEGLFKVDGYSMQQVRGQDVFDVRLYREMDQVSMREVQLRPTADDVDDYIEYKRLREERQNRLEDPEPMPTTKMGQLLMHQDHLDLAKPLKTPALLAAESPLPMLKISPQLLSPSKSETALSPIIEETSPVVPQSSSFEEEISPGKPRPGVFAGFQPDTTGPDTPGVMTQNMPGAYVQSPGIDGTHEVPNFFAGIPSVHAALTRHYSQSSLTLETAQTEEEEPKDDRKDSAYTENTYQGPKRGSVVSIRSNSSTASAEALATQLEHLKAVTMRKGSMSSSFANDLKAMGEDLTQMRLEIGQDLKGKRRMSFDSIPGYIVDPEYMEQCLKGVHDDVNLMMEEVPVDTSNDTPEQPSPSRRDDRRDTLVPEGDIRDEFLARRPDITQVEFQRSLYSRPSPEQEERLGADVQNENVQNENVQNENVLDENASPLERFWRRHHARNASSGEGPSSVQKWWGSDKD